METNRCYNCFQEKGGDQGGPCPHCGYNPASEQGKYPFALPYGSILAGQYITGRVLGQGGFGITYLALDKKLNMKVAIKEFLPDSMAVRAGGSHQVTVYTGQRQENFQYGMERFLEEARVLAKFQGNPNIVGVRSYFEENGTAYFVMDYIEGTSFKAYIQDQGGRVTWQESARVLVPVMDALGAVHKEGIIHRDVTPDNIVLTKEGTVKLLDFGSARYSLGDKSKSLDVVLKAGYAPKEQYIRRGKQGPYTDVYSLAACFYAAVTGYLPPEALERMEEDNLVPPTTRGIKLPSGFEDAILKGLEVQPADRYQSMEEFRAAVLAACQELGQHPGPIPAPTPEPDPISEPEPKPDSKQTQEKKGNPAVLWLTSHKRQSAIAASCCAVLLVAAIGVGQQRSRNKPQNDPSFQVPGIYVADSSVIDNPGPDFGRQNTPSSNAATEDNNAASSTGTPAPDASTPAPAETLEPVTPTEPTAQEPAKQEPAAQEPKKQEPAVPEPPKQEPAKPAQPTKDELKASAENYKTNKQWNQAADSYRQMRTLGYITDKELGTELNKVGYAASSATDYTYSAPLYREAADLGNVTAMFNLALAYKHGRGVEKNETTAVQWYQKAADNGDADAMNNLGVCYEYGTGVTKDTKTAFQWYSKAAEKGSEAAYYCLGCCYKDGIGTDKDVEKAISWFQKYITAGGKNSEKAQKYINDIQAELNAAKVTKVTNESFTMVTSKFSVKGVYTGEWKDGKPNGEGTLTVQQTDDRWDYGDTLWSKNWSNGLIEGYGQWRSAVDGAYDGNFSKGLKSGYGKMWFSDGTVYDGQWSGGDFKG